MQDRCRYVKKNKKKKEKEEGKKSAWSNDGSFFLIKD